MVIPKQQYTWAVQVDGMTAESWAEIVREFRDASLYQSWAYGAVQWGARNLSHLVLRKDGRVVAGAQLRIVRLPFVPAGLAYLRWGPLCVRHGEEPNLPVLTRMLQALKLEYVGRRGLALQVLANASQDTRRAKVFQAGFSAECFRVRPVARSAYRTLLLPLSSDLDELRKRLDQKWRNQLNRAEKNGLFLRSGNGNAEFKDFLRLYESMWDRKRFETSVAPQDFASMQELLPFEQKMQVLTAEQDGEPVAGLVFSCLGDTGIYLLGASNDKGRGLKASYLLQWHAISCLKQKRAVSYDLGGIDPDANPGVHHFKSGLNGAESVHLPLFVAARPGLSSLVMSATDWIVRIRHRQPRLQRPALLPREA